MASRLVACPSCGCHARRTENACPHCGAALRTRDGGFGITATALLLGFSAVSLPAASSGCGDEVRDVDDDDGMSSSNSSGTDSTGSAPAYGVPETVGVGGTMSSGIGGNAQAYGVPETTGVGANGGLGGTGGTGGTAGSGGSGGAPGTGGSGGSGGN